MTSLTLRHTIGEVPIINSMETVDTEQNKGNQNTVHMFWCVCVCVDALRWRRRFVGCIANNNYSACGTNLVPHNGFEFAYKSSCMQTHCLGERILIKMLRAYLKIIMFLEYIMGENQRYDDTLSQYTIIFCNSPFISHQKNFSTISTMYTIRNGNIVNRP